MGALIAKSFVPDISDEQMKNTVGCISFISFERAIEQDLNGRASSEVKGYKVTEYGIEIIWK